MHGNPNATHWNVEDGYQLNANGNKDYPIRIFDSYLYTSMISKLSITIDNSYHLCILPVGFVISLNMPDEVVDIYKNSFVIPPEQYTFVWVKPRVMVTSKGLRRYAPQKRGCYFQHERKLRFFKTYSREKCRLECLANFIKKECGCVAFYMPSQFMVQNAHCRLSSLRNKMIIFSIRRR